MAYYLYPSHLYRCMKSMQTRSQICELLNELDCMISWYKIYVYCGTNSISWLHLLGFGLDEFFLLLLQFQVFFLLLHLL